MGLSDFELYDRALQTNIKLAVKELYRAEATLRSLDFDIDAYKDGLSMAYQGVVQKYGKFAGLAAKEFYEAERKKMKLKSVYDADFVDDIGIIYLTEDAHKIFADELEMDRKHGFDFRYDAVADRFSAGTIQRVMQHADETLLLNCREDPAHPRYAIAPHPGACGFCLMIASRGFVYHSEASASRQRHPHCRCTPIIGFKKFEKVGTYDPKVYEALYSAASHRMKDIREMWYRLSDAEKKIYKDKEWRFERAKMIKLLEEFSGGVRSLEHAYGRCEDTVKRYAHDQWSAMSKTEREHHGTRKEYLHRQITKEICERDWEWLRTGKKPEITFETPELEAEIKKKRPHEIRTAERLVSQGVRADFIVDQREVFDEKSGMWQSVGQPDFRSGIEIKTLLSARSYNSINNHIKNASKKKGINTLIIDNSENRRLTDEKLIDHIERNRRFKGKKIYIINSEEDLLLIK